MQRRILRAVLAVLPIAGVFVGASPAHADPFFPDPQTSVVVTRLTVAAGRGWLVLQPRIGHDTAIGFEVTIPAGAGSWSGPATIPLLDMGISCVRRAGPDLDYLCGSDDAWADPSPALLPSGGYQVSIPVTRTGPVTGLIGATKYWEINPYEGAVSYASDTFPVVDPTHFFSTAEVRNFYTDVSSPYYKKDRGDIAATMTVVPGEYVHEIDFRLPPADWRLDAWSPRSNVECDLTGAPAAPLIQCVYSWQQSFPTGRYPFVVRVEVPTDEDFSAGQQASVALPVNGAAPEVQDTFGWFTTIHY